MLFSIKPLFVLAAMNYVVLVRGDCFFDAVNRVCPTDQFQCICGGAPSFQNLELVAALVETCLPAGSRDPVSAEQLISAECAASDGWDGFRNGGKAIRAIREQQSMQHSAQYRYIYDEMRKQSSKLATKDVTSMWIKGRRQTLTLASRDPVAAHSATRIRNS
ncbi:hypothetical protein BD410DRAFT_807537 [Rickenella mellea]|uniref:Extracellular membrane protein CFEM domain-containing protein n=1 Tax=Rickenella mellea TaxID=50990 RepID=A0A4Y7PPR6_9AGAM|nr:hypothetical protein BD410DRAFT_807537 [Rickenella mellea]